MQLLEGEKIIIKAKPKPAVRAYWLVSSIHIWIIFCLFATGFITSVTVALSASISFLPENAIVTAYTTFIILFLSYGTYNLVATILRYDKMQFWITNKRIVIQKGLIGTSQTSLPLERIGEIIVKQTFLQKMFDIKMLSMEVVGIGGRNEAMPAIPNADNVKLQILELLSKKRKAEKLSY